MKLVPTRWHGSRAKNKRELFERVERCAKAEGHSVTLVCRDCGDSTAVQVGCSSHWFCSRCKLRTAQRFRKDFVKKRMGLITTAARAGLTRRRQKREERWGERFLTLTLPHVGGARQRVQVLKKTWGRFWRLLQDKLRPELNRPSGILLGDLPAAQDRNGIKLRKGEHGESELSLYDVLSYLHVLEWTPGDDGLGHPHIHVWLFSPYLEQPMLEQLWREAYAHVSQTPFEEIGKLIVHIEAAKEGVEHELIKYLTKDWELSPDGAKRVAPEVFAQVYAELDGKRLRQSSAGFGRWAIAEAKFCPCCGYENERGHWARVDIEHALDKHKAPIGVERSSEEWNAWLARALAEAERERVPLTAADLAAYEAHLVESDQRWTESIDLMIVRGRMRQALEVKVVPKPQPRGLVALTRDAIEWSRAASRADLVDLVSTVIARDKPKDADGLANEYIYTWSRFLAWHVSFAMATCYQRASDEAEAIAVFRNEEIHGELRRTVLRMTRDVLKGKA